MEALALALEGAGPEPQALMDAHLAAHYPGRLPSELDAEPLVPMLHEIEARHVIETWAAMDSASRGGTSYDELQKQRLPYIDELLAVRPAVLRAKAKARAAEEAARAAAEIEE